MSVPGPTSISAWFCLGFSMDGPLLPAAEGPTATSVRRRAIHGDVIHQVELQGLFFHSATDRDPVERFRRAGVQPRLRNALQGRRVLALQRPEQLTVLVFVDDEVAEA